MSLDGFGIIELLFWNPAARGRLVAEWRLMLRGGGGAGGGRGGGGGEAVRIQQVFAFRSVFSLFWGNFNQPWGENKHAPEGKQRQSGEIALADTARSSGKAAEGGQVASGSVRVCEEGPTGEPARKHSLFPKKFTLVRAQVTWVLARS